MVINADDFGYSHSVNLAVAQCFRQGLINRTTLMVNMPATEEAVRLAREEGFFHKVGLHINLTEGQPLTQAAAQSPLCGPDGRFAGTFHKALLHRFYLNRATRQAIRQETEAQIRRFLELGFPLRHADSHNYTHVYLSVYASIRGLLEQYGFRTLRISRNLPLGSFSLPRLAYKRLFNHLLRRQKADGKPVGATAYFGSVQDFECSPKERVKHDLELMTHPVLQNGVLMDNTLPNPHPFVTRQWILENGLHLEDVTGQKRKLLVCFIQAHVGGAMTSLVNFLNALDTDRYDVDLMFYQRGEGRYGIKPEIHFLPQGKRHQGRFLGVFLRRLWSPRYDWAILRGLYYEKVRHNRPAAIQVRSKQGCRYSAPVTKTYDLAIAYESAWPMYYVMTRVKAQKKILWHHMDYKVADMLFQQERRAFQRADALVFVSEECRAAFAQGHPELAAKTRFLPNLLSADYVRRKGEEEQASLPFETPERFLKFLTVARVNFVDKGLDRPVRALARLKEEGLAGRAKWVVIGKGRDVGRLEEMVRQYGLEDTVFLLGLRENPYPYMKLCDVLLLPSRFEGKPMVVTEGFLMGLVPLVTRYTSAGEQIQHGVDGFVVDNDDEALYQGMKTLLENPALLEGPRAYIRSCDYGNQREIAQFDKLVEELFP